MLQSLIRLKTSYIAEDLMSILLGGKTLNPRYNGGYTLKGIPSIGDKLYTV